MEKDSIQALENVKAAVVVLSKHQDNAPESSVAGGAVFKTEKDVHGRGPGPEEAHTPRPPLALGACGVAAQTNLDRISMVGIARARPEVRSAGYSHQNGRSGRRFGRGPGSGLGADSRGPDAIQMIGAGPRTSTSWQNAASEKRSIVQIRA